MGGFDILWFLRISEDVWGQYSTASKLPQKSDLTSDMKSVTSITYISMCILIVWKGPFWQPQRPLRPPNSLRGHVWPQISNQWPQLHMLPCVWMLQLALICYNVEASPPPGSKEIFTCGEAVRSISYNSPSPPSSSSPRINKMEQVRASKAM